MKTRNGYVSNSSSSSFIFAYNENASLKIEGSEIILTMRDFFGAISMGNGWASESTSLVENTASGILEYEKREAFCGEPDRPFLTSLRKFFKDNERDGIEFAKVNISYHDEFISKLYEAFKSKGDIVEFCENEN